MVSGLIGIALICAIGMIAAARLRSHEIGQAERNLKTLDLLLGEETERAIQSADLIVRSFQEKIAKDGVTTAAELQATQANLDTYTLLRSRIAGVPQIAAINVIGQNGSVIVSSRSFPAPSFRIEARFFFQQLKTASRDAFVVSDPIQNFVDGSWTSYFARRINGPSGEFLGVVSAAVDLAYFEDLYKALDVGRGGAVSLWTRDGVLMARYPPLQNGVGRKFAIRSFSGILRSEPVTYASMTSIDGTARIVSTIAAKQFPLVINVTATFDQVLQDWRQTATIILIGCLFCISAVVLVLWLLARQLRAYAALDVAQAERVEAVAARDHAEDQLRQAQKLDAIGQLTGGVAHDFNNLLTAVLGNLELLQRHGRDQDERFLRWTQNALEAAQRGATLTQRLLAFSRRQPLNPTATDVARLVRSMSDLLERTIGENVRMETRLDPDLRHADVDANQLDNAILNIAINARDAMEGRGTLTIAARNVVLDQAFCKRTPGLASGNFVLIAITDTGCGIPAAVLEQVFEPFFTTKPIGQGTGLGLSQVYGFVKQTGGHIEIDSTIGVGTKVEIYLPCAEGQSEAIVIRDVVEEFDRVRRGLRVLVVEDDGVVLTYSLELMRELGFEVAAAADATQALAAMHGAQFDLLFTDIALPGLNGHELALQAKRLQPDLKVLFTSGYTRDVLMHQGRLDRGVQLLPKPFTGAQLKAKLDQVLVPAALKAAVG
ncbi:ATP-binding protein [Beijerinckia sp. L45]|uniref:ATP-binding protein n=1 Tax=Beijerinckia sp. L45 TaxID=1641855 RepID=UPI00131EA8A2|nr:ATP-binding protein [Beijerinckia sp. L45]